MSKKKKEKSKKSPYNKSSLTHSMLAIFSKHPTQTFNYKQMAQRLEIKDSQTKNLISEILYELRDNENVVEISRGKYKFKSKGGYVTGIVDLSSKGYAHIISDDMDEIIYVSKNNLNHALHNDKVKVYLYAKRKSRHFEGEITEIIERSKTTFVGIVDISPNFAFLIPNHKAMPFDIFIPRGKLNKVKNGQVALAKIIDWPTKAKNPVGEIVEVLGNAGENNTEMHAILAEFDLPYKFNANINKAANKISDKISKSEIENRRDFRSVPTFTIDPEDAKDFDDALSFQKLSNGNYEVGVHIADVTHYIQPNTILDKEANERATSVYLVDRVVPMLPEKISNNICSLRPNEEKLTFSAVFEMDENANIINSWFGKTIIFSNRRFSYEDALSVIDTGEGDMSDAILKLDKLAKILRENRFKNGSVNFEHDEIKFHLNEHGVPVSVYFKEISDSNHLIEEFMLLANKKVAEFIGKTKNNIKPKTFVYRVHDKPDLEKFNAFAKLVTRFGYTIESTKEKKVSNSINNLLNQIKGKKEQNMLEKIAVRTMAKAIYTTKNIGHYGLNFDFYSHFTSPIRRYPDMMVHRLLHHYLSNGKNVQDEKYETTCKHCSFKEQLSEKAERSSIKYKQVEFMQDKLGQEFDGIISGITEWGIYVEIIENKCEGMIPMRELDDDFYIFDEENFRLIGKQFHKTFQLGDKISIEVKNTNLVKKHLDFALATKENNI